MGEVFLALDTQLERTVALKIVRQAAHGNPQAMRRLFQEARAVAALNHPNVAQVYEVDEREGIWFIAMEYVEGVTLFEKLKVGPLEPDSFWILRFNWLMRWRKHIRKELSTGM